MQKASISEDQDSVHLAKNDQTLSFQFHSEGNFIQ